MAKYNRDNARAKTSSKIKGVLDGLEELDATKKTGAEENLQEQEKPETSDVVEEKDSPVIIESEVKDEPVEEKNDGEEEPVKEDNVIAQEDAVEEEVANVEAPVQAKDIDYEKLVASIEADILKKLRAQDLVKQVEIKDSEEEKKEIEEESLPEQEEAKIENEPEDDKEKEEVEESKVHQSKTVDIFADIDNNKKSKRSYMITDAQALMIYKLRMMTGVKDLSDVVGDAVEFYYKYVVDNGGYYRKNAAETNEAIENSKKDK